MISEFTAISIPVPPAQPDALVCVVDDDKAVRDCLERLLRSARFHVETFASAEAYLARRICETLGLDRSTLWLFSRDDAEMALTCFWQRPGSPPLRLNFITRGNLPWAEGQVRDGKPFRFSSLSELPPQAAKDRESLSQHGTKSNVTFPLVTHGKVLGALAFATHSPPNATGPTRRLTVCVSSPRPSVM